jgi:beta-1,4-mannosyl-glycoprotein beta-1,4-N-acetylglucosaminyltransferase
MPKPMCLENNAERFRAFKDKIIYLRFNQPMLPNISPWIRESAQRDYTIEGLRDCSPDDIIITSDADEIIKKEAIELYDPKRGVTPLRIKMSYYYVNCVSNEDWFRPQIMTYKDLALTGVNTMRYRYFGKCIDNAGWHFSYLGGVENIQKKIDAFCHTEFSVTKESIENSVRDRVDLFGRNVTQYKIEPLDDSYPKYLLDNQEKFKHLIAEVQ